MESNVVVFPIQSHTNMTVRQALNASSLEGLRDMIVIGLDADGNFVLSASSMTNEAALWIIKKAEMHVLGQ
jgi:hypothetical protein